MKIDFSLAWRINFPLVDSSCPYSCWCMHPFWSYLVGRYLPAQIVGGYIFDCPKFVRRFFNWIGSIRFHFFPSFLTLQMTIQLYILTWVMKCWAARSFCVSFVMRSDCFSYFVFLFHPLGIRFLDDHIIIIPWVQVTTVLPLSGLELFQLFLKLLFVVWCSRDLERQFR